MIEALDFASYEAVIENEPPEKRMKNANQKCIGPETHKEPSVVVDKQVWKFGFGGPIMSDAIMALRIRLR